jgi:hypothetical protein
MTTLRTEIMKLKQEVRKICKGNEENCNQVRYRAFFKKLQLMGPSLNQGLFPTQLRQCSGPALALLE